MGEEQEIYGVRRHLAVVCPIDNCFARTDWSSLQLWTSMIDLTIATSKYGRSPQDLNPGKPSWSLQLIFTRLYGSARWRWSLRIGENACACATYKYSPKFQASSDAELLLKVITLTSFYSSGLRRWKDCWEKCTDLQEDYLEKVKEKIYYFLVGNFSASPRSHIMNENFILKNKFSKKCKLMLTS